MPKGAAYAVIGFGGLLAWSGLTNASVLESAVTLLGGGKPQPDTGKLGIATPGGSSGEGGGTAPAVPADVRGNLAKGKFLATRMGWGSGPEWDALVRLWNSESGWNNKIWNTSASCGNDAYAYGIPQFCGHGVHKTIPGHGSVCPFPAGNPGNPPECGGVSSAVAQIWAGLMYIKTRYKRPTLVPLGGY